MNKMKKKIGIALATGKWSIGLKLYRSLFPEKTANMVKDIAKNNIKSYLPKGELERHIWLKGGALSLCIEIDAIDLRYDITLAALKNNQIFGTKILLCSYSLNNTLLCYRKYEREYNRIATLVKERDVNLYANAK